MKIYTLMENTAASEEFVASHGLSFYIETKNHRILFDMGPDGRFLENADRLGVDISKVDLAILSHGHYDHGGGLAAFLEANSTALVHIQKKPSANFLPTMGTEHSGISDFRKDWKEIPGFSATPGIISWERSCRFSRESPEESVIPRPTTGFSWPCTGGRSRISSCMSRIF